MIILKIYYHIIAIIKKVFYKIIYGKHIKFGKKVTFRKGFSLVIEDNAVVEIGEGCFFNNYCSINAKVGIKIGENSIFGENVKLYDHNHIFKYEEELIKKQGFKSEKIEIGNNCWLGSNVVILKGVKVGNNSVVGAGEVVSRNIDSNTLLKNGSENNIKYVRRENA